MPGQKRKKQLFKRNSHQKLYDVILSQRQEREFKEFLKKRKS